LYLRLRKPGRLGERDLSSAWEHGEGVILEPGHGEAFRDDYNDFERRPEKVVAFFDRHVK
jgi:hypothetical protein